MQPYRRRIHLCDAAGDTCLTLLVHNQDLEIVGAIRVRRTEGARQHETAIDPAAADDALRDFVLAVVLDELAISRTDLLHGIELVQGHAIAART